MRSGAGDSLERIQDQAGRYMVAVYGDTVGYRAPETFNNILERWILAISACDIEAAEREMCKIEQMAEEDRKRRG